MKMLMTVEMPHEPFNSLVREGKTEKILGRILEELKPDSIYFTEHNGTRGCVAVVDVKESSEIPKFAEPFFLHFNADCKFRVAITPEELRKANLGDLGKKWA
jgi:hypothetical protein